tara:strand:+ start:1177 stop:1992 length:816 start_codon:yes stop_codon:yes gene_type:complete
MIKFFAEIGINHNGDIDLAKKLIDASKRAGCDGVKFQKRTIDVVYDKEMLDSPRESPWGTTQRQQKEGLEFGFDEYSEIDRYCKEIGIDWFCSAWDLESQRFIKQFDLQYNKIASAMITHEELLEEVASESKQTFISTGMSNLKIIDKAVQIFEDNLCPYTLMHCVSTYPTKYEDCNIEAMRTLLRRYSENVGYSGHEIGIIPTIAAVFFGAVAIERHITLDKTMYGSDQSSSLDEEEFTQLIDYSKKLFGNGRKEIIEEEKEIIKKLRYW